MKHHLLKLIVLFLSFSTFSYAGQVINVIGQNNISVDRPAIQAAVDQAKPSDIIQLSGTFQLDGTSIDLNKSQLTIQGSGTAVLLGLTNASGAPRGDIGAPSPHHFNRAFEVSHDAKSITIDGIKFVNLNRGVQIAPQITTQTDICTDIVIGNGGSNYIVKNSEFINNLRPLNVIADADNVTMKNNVITGSRTRDVSIGGFGSLACLMPNGSGGFTSVLLQGIGSPKNTNFSSNNINQSLAAFAIAALEAENVVFDSNNISCDPAGACTGVITLRVSKGTVSNNVIDMAGIGFFGIAIDPASQPVVYNNPKSTVFSNTVKNSVADVGVGIAVDSASGLYAYDNHFSAMGGVDYLICDANADTNLISSTLCDGLGIVSTGNTIIVNDPTVTVMDLGVDNKVIFDKKK